MKEGEFHARDELSIAQARLYPEIAQALLLPKLMPKRRTSVSCGDLVNLLYLRVRFPCLLSEKLCGFPLTLVCSALLCFVPGFN